VISPLVYFFSYSLFGVIFQLSFSFFLVLFDAFRVCSLRLARLHPLGEFFLLLFSSYTIIALSIPRIYYPNIDICLIIYHCSAASQEERTEWKTFVI
jgi:hypothetical protein